MKFSCIQTEPKASFEDAISEALSLSKKAIKYDSEFICLPEYCGGLLTDSGAFCPPSESENKHPFLNEFISFAKQNKVFILLGSIAIKGKSNKIINRSFILDDNGKIISRYDKIHLFDVNLSQNQTFKESELVSGGNQLTTCETRYGTLGQTICYDIRFPYLYRDLAQKGAEIIFIPAVFTKKTGEAHWHVLNRSRAIENGAYVISPSAVGKIKGGGEGYGHSLIVNPWGNVIADAGAQRGIISADINLSDVKDTRSKIPSLNHDKEYTFKN